MNILLAQLIVVFLCNAHHLSEEKFKQFVKITEPYFEKEFLTERELEFLAREYKKIRGEIRDLLPEKIMKGAV